jgi:hypothetical protein
VIFTRDEEKILQELRNSSDGKCEISLIMKYFNSGARAMVAIEKLSQKKLVDYRSNTLSLTEQGLAEVDHTIGSSRRWLSRQRRSFSSLARLLAALAIFIFGYALGFLTENLSPRFYCQRLPEGFAAVLEPCEIFAEKARQ